MTFQTVGVVGVGQMGSGIVETFARAGCDVVAREINDELLERGKTYLQRSLARGVERGKLTQVDADAALGHITYTTHLADFAHCDLVIEAATENMPLKKTLFTELDVICKDEAILASNTSSLSITEIASATQRPDKVVGLHFFNPVPVMPLIEIVRGLLTSDETLDTVRTLGAVLKKEIVIAKDNPGFIVNLLLVPYLFDAIRALENGVATKEDIDTAIKLGLNHPMGPFTLLDFVGLDTCLFIGDAMYQEFKDVRYAAPPLLRRMVTAGLLGRKSGRGFYTY
ncbi:MAG TPA: 3-hydroxybutyryl-CoA dehydrogenase [Anaerolineae bacterium]|nr:3-hydroxybutyryl-CoA dehydrogenase [Anaerolineae bacterium]